MVSSPWKRLVNWGWSLISVGGPKKGRRKGAGFNHSIAPMEQRILLTTNARPDNYTVAIGQTLGPVKVTANDTSKVDFLGWSGATNTPGLSLSSTGYLTYTPLPGAPSTVVLYYTVEKDEVAQGTVTIQVTEAAASDSPPTVQNLVLTSDTGTPGDNITTDPRITASLSDPDGGGTTYAYEVDWNNDGTADVTTPTSLNTAFTYDLASHVGYGTVNVQVRGVQTSSSGTVSPGAWSALTFNYQAPPQNAAPTVQTLALVNDTGTPGDLITSDPRITATLSDPDGGGLVYGYEVDWNGDGTVDSSVDWFGDGPGYGTPTIPLNTPFTVDLTNHVSYGAINAKVRGLQKSSSGGITSGDWSTLSFTYQAPQNVAPVVQNLTLTNDTGTAGDLITTDPRITALLSDPDGGGDVYSMQIDWNGDGVADDIVSASLNTPKIYSLTGKVSYGTVTAKVRGIQTDMSGIESVGAWSTLTFDYQAPPNVAPTVQSLTLTNDTGTAADSITTDPRISVTLSDPDGGGTACSFEIDWNNDGVVDDAVAATLGESSVYDLTSHVTHGIVTAKVRGVQADSAGVTSTGEWSTLTFVYDLPTTEGGGSGGTGGTGSGGTGGTGTGDGSGDTGSGSSGTGSTGGTGTGSTGSGSTGGTGSGSTGSSTSGLTRADGTPIDTSAADSAFSQAILAAFGSYDGLLQAAAAARASADEAAWDNFLDQIAAADSTLAAANAASKATYDAAIAAADQSLASSNQSAWAAYNSQIAELDDEYEDDVAQAKTALNTALAAAAATRAAADLVSKNAYLAVLSSADAALAAATGSATQTFNGIVAAADAAYNAAVTAAMNTLNAAALVYMQQHGYGEIGDDGWMPPPLSQDSQYQSDLAAARAAHDAALETAEDAFNAAYDAALEDYNSAITGESATHEATLASNLADYEDAVDAAMSTYNAEVAAHAATANAAIEEAEDTLDAALDAADQAYDDAVAAASDARSDAHDAHLDAFESGEESAWQQLQSQLQAAASAHTSAVNTAITSGNSAVDAAWTAYNTVANNSESTHSDRDAALAARLTTIAGALSSYNNAIAAAGAAYTNAEADAWETYHTTVNGLVSAYWNAEAQADATETKAVNAAYVTWAEATEAAWSEFGEAEAAAESAEALANAQSANTASHEISAAMTALEIADANEEHAHNGVVLGIEEAFVTAILPAGVAYDDAVADADAAQAIAFASALSSATNRWVSTAPAGSPVPAYFTAFQAATVTRTTAVANASKNLKKAIHAAESTWVTTVLPGWKTYATQLSEHAKTEITSTSPDFETYENAIADAGDSASQASAAPAQQLNSALESNYSTWVSSIVNADKTYGNSLADSDVNATSSSLSAAKTFADATQTNASTEVHAQTAADVALIGQISGAIVSSAAMLAGQITGASGGGAPGGSSGSASAQSANIKTNTDGSSTIEVDLDGDGVIDFTMSNDGIFNGGVYIPGHIEKLLLVLSHLDEIIALNQQIDALEAVKRSLQAQLQAMIDQLENGIPPTEEEPSPEELEEWRDGLRSQIAALQQQLQSVILQLSELRAQLSALEASLGMGGTNSQGQNWNYHGGAVATGLRNLDKVFIAAANKSRTENHGIEGITITDAEFIFEIVSGAFVIRRLARRAIGRIASSRVIETVLDEGGAKLLRITTANGKTIEVITEPILKGNKLILRGTHIGGAAPGEVGVHELYEIARQYGRQYGVKQVIIEGGMRSSGRMIGKFPRPIVIELE